MVQNGLITMANCRVAEVNRLQADASFRDTAKVLRMTRAGVAWMATGCGMGAYEHALAYAQKRIQFGKPIGSFQLVQDLLAKMLGNVTASQCMVVRLSQMQDEDRVVYPAYLSAPRHVSLSALQDQECAGALMWLCVTIAYVIPAAIITTQLLSAPTDDPPRPLRTNLHESPHTSC